MHMFYACSSSLSVSSSSSFRWCFSLVLEHFQLFAMPTPYPMHNDAHCWVMCIIGRERERDIFLLPVCSTYWPGKYTTHVDPHIDNSRKVWSWYDHPLPSYSVFVSWYVTWPCDLDLLTLISCHTWRVTWPTLPPSLNSWVLELWVIAFPAGYDWKCVHGHCSCAESRDPWVGGQKQLQFWNPWPRFAYSLYNFYWAPMRIKGHLLSSCAMLRPFLREKNSNSHRNGAQKWRFCGKWGSKP